MFEVVVICSTVLIVFGGLLWFANRFLTVAKVREQKLTQEIHAKVDEKLANVETKVLSVTEKLSKDVEGIFKNQQNINAAVGLQTPTRTSLIQKLQANMEASRKK